MRGEKREDRLEIDGADLPLSIAAAHELKAPLALIRQLSLSLEAGDFSETEYRRVLRQVVLSAERGIRLTNDLTRSVSLQDSLFELGPVNPRELIEDVAHELMPLFRAKNREIRISGSSRPLLAIANRDLLRRIIINFSDNALYYTREDTPVEIRAGTLSHGEIVRLGVRDFGPAVPSDIWHRLRAGLGRSPQAMSNRPGSSGLGLFVAGKFADAMQGRIGAIRHRDGATFYVDLMASRQLSLL